LLLLHGLAAAADSAVARLGDDHFCVALSALVAFSDLVSHEFHLSLEEKW
jgi:hypothetical protein